MGAFVIRRFFRWLFCEKLNWHDWAFALRCARCNLHALQSVREEESRARPCPVCKTLQAPYLFEMLLGDDDGSLLDFAGGDCRCCGEPLWELEGLEKLLAEGDP